MAAGAPVHALRTRAAGAFCIALVLALAGCGFQLRGQVSLPFRTVYIEGNTSLIAELRRNIVAGTGTRVVNRAPGAEAVLEVRGETREKVIQSLDTAGRVREYQLRYRVAFRVGNDKGEEWLRPSEIQLTRDISFNDAQVLAKESEEALLYRDMQADMVHQIMRRLAAARLTPG
ncbi:MAG: hypothetical protein IT514_02200 [Burkholderiales bacterium]|nr:hypothetical protein [Burkholderiales bacterium]